jgi:hypothetical protein
MAGRGVFQARSCLLLRDAPLSRKRVRRHPLKPDGKKALALTRPVGILGLDLRFIWSV